MIGSAKVAIFFDFPNLKRKIFKFFFSLFQSNRLLLKRECKGKGSFFDFARSLKNFFFSALAKGARCVRHQSQPGSSLSFVFRLGHLRFSRFPVGLLPFGTAKIERLFGQASFGLRNKVWAGCK